MSWLDLTSPSLQAHMNAWCELRGPRKLPHVNDFVKFTKYLPPGFAATVSASEKRECTFVAIGENMSPLFPGCNPGLPFSRISPLPVRLSISRMFAGVISSRQPAVQRSTYGDRGAQTFYEHMILPFIDARFDVRAMAVLADGYDLQQRDH